MHLVTVKNGNACTSSQYMYIYQRTSIWSKFCNLGRSIYMYNWQKRTVYNIYMCVEINFVFKFNLYMYLLISPCLTSSSCVQFDQEVRRSEFLLDTSVYEQLWFVTYLYLSETLSQIVKVFFSLFCHVLCKTVENTSWKQTNNYIV